MTGVLNLFLSLIRFVVSWGDRLLFGRICPNHTGAGTVLTLPFWGAAVCMVFLCYMQIAKGAGSTFGDTVFCLELSIAFVSIAMHYKHYFRMPTVKLKILYFLYLTVLTVVMSYLFIWLFVWVLIILFVLLLFGLFASVGSIPVPQSIQGNSNVITLEDGTKVKQSASNPSLFKDITSGKEYIRSGDNFMEK